MEAINALALDASKNWTPVSYPLILAIRFSPRQPLESGRHRHPVASNSGSIINTMVSRHNGTVPKLHADFGSPLDQNLYGIPVNVADHTTPKYTIYIPEYTN